MAWSKMAQFSNAEFASVSDYKDHSYTKPIVMEYVFYVTTKGETQVTGKDSTAWPPVTGEDLCSLKGSS